MAAVEAAREAGMGRGASPAAVEGTAAHALGALCLREGRRAAEYIGYGVHVPSDAEFDAGQRERLVNYGSVRKVPISAKVIAVDVGMAEAVQVYLDYVAEVRALATERCGPGGWDELIEQELDLTYLHPDLGGSSDHILRERMGWLFVADYKHGRGVVVEVEDNAQLMTYALGSMRRFPGVEGVVLAVVQPRAPHEDGRIRTVEYTVEELEAFEERLGEAAVLANLPDARLSAGDWCRFCDALPTCPEAQRAVSDAAGSDFPEEPPVTGTELATVDPQALATRTDEMLRAADEAGADVAEELSRLARWVPLVENWAGSVMAAIELALLRGVRVPGYKLVQKRGTRQWDVGEEEVVKALRKVGPLKKDMYAEPKLKSPAQMEKLSKVAKGVVAELCSTQSSGLTVAREDDPRPAIEPPDPASDFPHIEES